MSMSSNDKIRRGRSTLALVGNSPHLFIAFAYRVVHLRCRTMPRASTNRGRGIPRRAICFTHGVIHSIVGSGYTYERHRVKSRSE